MPVGNQQVWDQGIGAPATNMLMQSVGRGAAAGYNPIGLGGPNNVSQAGAQEPINPLTPATSDPAATSQSAQPAMPVGQGQSGESTALGIPPSRFWQQGGKYYVNGQEVSYEEYLRQKNSAAMGRIMSGGAPRVSSQGGLSRFMQTG